jgi:adenosylcobyric acid synthase
MGKIILVTGTSSGAGKSTIVTALCRILSDMGYRVAPFKASNMSRNSVSLDDGSEIARAQWLQAVAARVSPSKEMNPVLLKPEGNRASQVILDGRSCGVMDIAAYREFLATKARDVVGRSLRKLAESYQVVPQPRSI